MLREVTRFQELKGQAIWGSVTSIISTFFDVRTGKQAKVLRQGNLRYYHSIK